MLKENLVLTDQEIENVLSRIDVGNEKDCWNWTMRTNSSNRPIYSIVRDNRTYTLSVQRISLENFLGHPVESRYIDSVCGNPICCNPKHLGERDLHHRLFGNTHLDDDTGCWEWLGAISGKNGYGVITINGKAKSAHRVSYEISVGKIEKGLMVLHKCNNRICINPEHLYLGTHNDNMRDMAHTQAVKGENNAMARLSESDVKEIKKLIKERTMFYRDIAEKYGVKRQTIKDIALGRTWSWMK